MPTQIGKLTTIALGARPALTDQEEKRVQDALQQAVWDIDINWTVKLNRTRFVNSGKSCQIASVFLGLSGPDGSHLYLVVTTTQEAGELSLHFTLSTETDRSPVVNLPRHLELWDARGLINKAIEYIKNIEGLIAA